MKRCPWLLALVGLVVLLACAPNDVVQNRVAKKLAQPDWCVGCGPQGDPNPDSIGVFIAANFNEDECINGGIYQDTDRDGLADICEEKIAEAFNPWLHYSSHDIAWGGEPAVAVRPVFREGAWFVRILYMPAYYDDAGDVNDNDCWGGFWTFCAGHLGDSEAIILEVRYDNASEHWILNDATFSQHEGYQTFFENDVGTMADRAGGSWNDMDYFWSFTGPSNGTYPTLLTYTQSGRPGGAPDIEIAVNKHANYATPLACNHGGGFLGIGHDSCSSDAWMQLYPYDDYVGFRNVGSRAVKLLDIVPSRNPVLAGLGYTESFWSDTSFAGWSGITNPRAPGYGVRLSAWLF